MIKKTILLTGAGGMVGQNLLEHQDISSYDILTPRSSELDLRDFEEVKKYLKKYTLKDTVDLIFENEKISKKKIYDLCLKIKNEKNN